MATKKAAKKLKADRGWGFPLNSKKAHYFIAGHAMCGGWMFFGALENDAHDSIDNCKACMKKRASAYPEEK